MDNLLFLFSFMLIVLFVFPKLIKYIKKKKRFNLMKKSGIKDIDRMQGYQFKEYLKVLFKELGYRPIVTQKSGDYGADVVLKGRNKIVIQAKRYGYKHNVSMDAVREVLAAMFFYKADEAWVITNSFFTKQAKTLAKACGVKLLNRYELERFIVTINPTQQPKQFARKRGELN
ncbi:restriction endonuclease [Virgibacillus salexigens]|uniref:restriction endonuclease n=1 Tax=Virgibacillus salexigens TaxID=61016 RepID=UPI00190C8E1E|nr:restriction endonuclease [Virgibacillus salexigens]